MTLKPDEEKALLTVLVNYILPPLDGIGGFAAGVPEYLDQFLASEHGSQYVALIHWGIASIDSEHQNRYSKIFVQGEPQQCIELLEELAESENSHYQAFWRTLIQLCLQGFLAPPRNGGNRDGLGWQSVGYTGSVNSAVSLSLLATD